MNNVSHDFSVKRNAPQRGPRGWLVVRFAQVKEEPAERAGDTELNVLPASLLAK